MKRPTGDMKRWHRIHERKLNRRKYRHRARRTSRSFGLQRVHVEGRQGSFINLPCPEHLSFERDYEGVLKLISNIRDHSRRSRNERIYINFAPIRTVAPSGALVLAAELDRWNSLLGRSRFRRADTSTWAPNVRRLLGQMGFFDLLNLDCAPDVPSGDSLYVKFRSGTKVDGEAVEDLRQIDLEPFVSVPKERLLFAAVTEAMTNVVHHAYRGGHSGPEKWWLSAAHEANEVVILIYDQGAGIPKTLPLTLGERMRDLVPERLATHDGKLIEVAHQFSRSETRERHRGRGLQRDVRRYIEAHEGRGMYRVISGRGEYTVPAGTGVEGRVNSLPRPLQGTLIEWRLKLQ